MNRNKTINFDHIPNQVRDYMRGVNTRFNEICDVYLTGLSIDDLKFLSPEDMINLVPPEQYNHKLLMTIMTRRYIYPNLCNDAENTHPHKSNDDDSSCRVCEKHKCSCNKHN